MTALAAVPGYMECHQPPAEVVSSSGPDHIGPACQRFDRPRQSLGIDARLSFTELLG